MTNPSVGFKETIINGDLAGTICISIKDTLTICSAYLYVQQIIKETLDLPNIPKGSENIEMKNETRSGSDRVTVRLPENQKEIIELAATYRGATFNQFLIQAAIQEATRVVEQEERLNVSQETARHFFDMLDSHTDRDEKIASLAARFEGKRIENGKYQHNYTRNAP